MVEKPDPERPKKGKTERKYHGETINFEAYRRLQVNLVRPSDLKSTMEGERKIGGLERGKDRNWEGMGMFLIMAIFGSIFGLLILSKVDLGGLFEGVGGGPAPSIPTLIRFVLRI